ncbi:hypothetical protein ACQPZQ_24360 [Pseudonocardia sp. CA-142604]|uniref:hypothetical protein n=1 Tax=Pseudonocardia sp. CA-142604 TaxID=3240024 RepID=UPI003D8C64E4
MTDSTPARPAQNVPARSVSSEVVAAVADRLGRDQVFGPAVTSASGTTLVPVARVRAGGGVGAMRPGAASTGAAAIARPMGAFSVTSDGKVSWHPAVDVNRIVLGGQITLAAVIVLVLGVLRRPRR